MLYNSSQLPHVSHVLSVNNVVRMLHELCELRFHTEIRVLCEAVGADVLNPFKAELVQVMSSAVTCGRASPTCPVVDLHGPKGSNLEGRDSALPLPQFGIPPADVFYLGFILRTQENA